MNWNLHKSLTPLLGSDYACTGLTSTPVPFTQKQPDRKDCVWFVLVPVKSSGHTDPSPNVHRMLHPSPYSLTIKTFTSFWGKPLHWGGGLEQERFSNGSMILNSKVLVKLHSLIFLFDSYMAIFSKWLPLSVKISYY